MEGTIVAVYRVANALEDLVDEIDRAPAVKTPNWAPRLVIFPPRRLTSGFVACLRARWGPMASCTSRVPRVLFEVCSHPQSSIRWLVPATVLPLSSHVFTYSIQLDTESRA